MNAVPSASGLESQSRSAANDEEVDASSGQVRFRLHAPDLGHELRSPPGFLESPIEVRNQPAGAFKINKRFDRKAGFGRSFFEFPGKVEISGREASGSFCGVSVLFLRYVALDSFLLVGRHPGVDAKGSPTIVDFYPERPIRLPRLFRFACGMRPYSG